MSMNTGPVRRLSAARMHSAAVAYASSADVTVTAFFVRLRTTSTWSISCSEPMPQRAIGALPPMTNIGESLPSACASAAVEREEVADSGALQREGDELTRVSGVGGHSAIAYGIAGVLNAARGDPSRPMTMTPP